MFADIVSYSRMMGANEKEALKLLADFDKLSIPVIEKFNGELIKKNGDEIFCEFNSAKHAVDASIEIQNALASYNDSRPKDFKLEVRIGVHIGDVVKKDDDIFGDGVNVASRIQPLAAPGGICISGAVSDALSSHPDYNIVSKGKQELKHIVQQHSIFELKTGHEDYELDSKIVIKNKIKGNVYWIIAFLSIFIFIFLYRDNIWTPKFQNDTSDCEIIMISKITSDIHYIDIVETYINKYGLENYTQIKKYNIKAISKGRLNIIYDELVYLLNSGNNYPIKLVNKYDLDESYLERGKEPLYYDLRSEMQLIKFEETNVFDYIGVFRDSSLNNFMFENDFEISLSPIIYELEDPIGGNNFIYTIFKRTYELNYVDTVFADNDTSYSMNFNAGYQAREYAMANDDDIAELISEDYLSIIKKRHEEKHGRFTGRVKNIAGEKVIIGFAPSIRPLITVDQLLRVRRIYGTENGGAEERMDDLLTYKDYIKSANSDKYLNEFRELNGDWTQSEINKLNDCTHPLSTDNNLWWNIGIPTYLKVDKIYDSTLVAIYFKKINPHVMIKPDDEVYLK